MTTLPLNHVLALLGLHTTPAGYGRKHLWRGDEVAFTGTAGETWAWLRGAGQEVRNG